MKRTPLTRKTPLTANKGLSEAREMKRGQTKPRAPRNTGPSVAVRKGVTERAHGACERCGQTIRGDYSIHHRKPRGMGGTTDPAANSPSNLVLLCGSATTPGGCHTAVEKFRESAISTGWIVPRVADPAKTPIKRHNGWFILNADYTMTPAERPEE